MSVPLPPEPPTTQPALIIFRLIVPLSANAAEDKATPASASSAIEGGTELRM